MAAPTIVAKYLHAAPKSGLFLSSRWSDGRQIVAGFVIIKFFNLR